MTDRIVRLVVEARVDAERPELCGDCWYGDANKCSLLGGWSTRALGPQDFTKPPTWRRTERCLESERLARANPAVLTEAEWCAMRVTVASESVRLLDELAVKGIYGRNGAEVAARFVDQKLQEFVDRPTLKLRESGTVRNESDGKHAD